MLRMKSSFCFKLLSIVQIVVLTAFFVLPSSLVQAQTFSVLSLPKPGAMVTTSEKFVPPLLKGISLHKENPLVFDFIIDPGNADLSKDEVQKESQKLVKYFLASLTIPDSDLWVNLSPYENNKIIPQAFGETEMGRDLLAQDYVLKQLSASLIYPEKDLGKDFWNKVYQKAIAKYGTADIPMSTFNKVWIVPEKAVIVETPEAAYVVKSRLKVMMEQDYVALDSKRADEVLGTNRMQGSDVNKLSEISSEVVREIIIPEIEREVNEGKNFSQLRQIYHSLILANWFKDNLKNNILNEVYSDQAKILGIDIEDKSDKEKIYLQYLSAYRQGVFNYIKEDIDEKTGEVMPRKYFSGGMEFDGTQTREVTDRVQVLPGESVSEKMAEQGLSVRDLSALEDDKDNIVVTAAVNPKSAERDQATLSTNNDSTSLSGWAGLIGDKIRESRERTERMRQSLNENNVAQVNQTFEQARVNLPGSRESSPHLFTIAANQAPSAVDTSSLDADEIIAMVKQRANFELTTDEANKLKNRQTFTFDTVEQSQRNGEVYVAALKSGLLGTRYVVTNIKRFSPDSHLAYMNDMQTLANEFNGNLVILLSVEESPNVLKGDGAGMQTAIDAISQVYGEDFLRQESLDIITDGGLKTRGGNITGKYGYNGVMPTSDGVNYYTRSIKTLGQVRLQHKGYGANRDFWTASDGDYTIGNISFGQRSVSDLDDDGSWKMMIHGAEETLFDASQKDQVFAKLAAAEQQAGSDAKALEQLLMQDNQIRDVLNNIRAKKLDQLGENFSDPQTGKIAQFVEKPNPVQILQLLRQLDTNRIIPNAFMIVYTKDGFMDQLQSYRNMTTDGKRLSEYEGSYFQAIVDAQFNPGALAKQPAPTRTLFQDVHRVLPKEQILAAGLGSVGKFTDRGKTQFLSDAYWERIDQAKNQGQTGLVQKGNVTIGNNVTINVLPGSTVVLENVKIESDTPVTLTLGDTYIQNSSLKLSEDTQFQPKTAIVDSVIQRPFSVFGGDSVVMGLIARDSEPMLDITSNGSWEEVQRVEIYEGETVVSIKKSNGERYINRTLTKADYKGAPLGKIIEAVFSGDWQRARAINPRLFGVANVSDETNAAKELIDIPNWRGVQGNNVSIGDAKSAMDYTGMGREKISIQDSGMLARDNQEQVGGIDLNPAKLKIEVDKQNGGIDVEFDPQILEAIRQQGIEGFVPVIINIQNIKSALPLLSQNEPTVQTANI